MAKAPTNNPRKIPPGTPPSGRENPRGAKEYPTLFPKLLIRRTESQNPPTTNPATAASRPTTESKAPCDSPTSAPEVDVIRDPSVVRIIQEPPLYGIRQKLNLPQLIDAYPAHLPQSWLGTWRDLGITPQDSIVVPLQRHPGHDVDRMPPLAQKLAHVQHPGEAGSKAGLLRELTNSALRYRLARLEPASRQHPVRVPVRLLVTYKEQCFSLHHHHRHTHAEVHARCGAVLAHAASIPAPQNTVAKQDHPQTRQDAADAVPTSED